MKWRPQGFSAAGFGVQGTWDITDKNVAQAVYDLASVKAIFTAPFQLEDPQHCVLSVIELRDELATRLTLASAKSELKRRIKTLILACNRFKAVAGRDGANFRNDQQKFETELNIFRMVFVQEVNAIIGKYNLP